MPSDYGQKLLFRVALLPRLLSLTGPKRAIPRGDVNTLPFLGWLTGQRFGDAKNSTISNFQNLYSIILP